MDVVSSLDPQELAEWRDRDFVDVKPIFCKGDSSWFRVVRSTPRKFNSANTAPRVNGANVPRCARKAT
jgi:hypothetical protein